MQMRYSFSMSLSLCVALSAVSVAAVHAQQANDAKPATSPGQKEDQKDAQKDKGAASSPPSQPIRPGKDRWLVKTASDPDAKNVNPTPVKSSLENMLKLPRPDDLPLRESSPTMQTHRAQPVETTVYTVEVDVIQCQLMPDGDYRVVLRGASGKTMVMEMPNPAPDYVDPASPFASQIRAARVGFDTKFQPERKMKTVSGHARITGIGYFGRAYGDKPAEGNLVQLHPVLNVEWLAKPSKDFKAPKEAPAPAPETPSKQKTGE